jgi:hypothetical protein
MRVPEYTRGKLRVIDFIESFSLGFSLGMVVKHVVRSRSARGKRRAEELRKAGEYLREARRRL